MGTTGVCGICGKRRKLQRSHIIPKFVTKHLRETSATGYLRGGSRPNLRVQDSKRLRLLCRGCEQLLATAEGQFAEDVFVPYHNSQFGSVRVKCGQWLLRFVASMAWRTVHVHLPDIRARDPHLATRVEVAWDTWGDYLRGQRADTKPYSHHVVFLGPVLDSSGIPFPGAFNRYLLRSFDLTIGYDRTHAFAYANLCGIILVSFVHPPDPPGWCSTKVMERGNIGVPQKIKWTRFLPFVVDRAAKAMEAMGQLSEPQSRRIRETMRADPARMLQSGSYEAIVYDRLLRSTRKEDDSGDDGTEEEGATDEETDAH